MSALRLGIVGCGRLAEAGYLPALRGSRFELVAVADPRRERRERVAGLAPRRAGGEPVAAHASAAELLAADGIEALVVASPASEHLEHASLASEHGVACLVEKPPAPDLSGSERLARLARPPWIGFNRRFAHGEPLLGRIPADGPLELELELRYRRASWRAVATRDDAVLDLAPHLVDLALLLAGATAATVRSARLSPERVQLELDTGRGRARIRCATDRAHRERITARRPGGAVLARSRSGGVVRGAAARLPSADHPLSRSLRAQLEAFARAVGGAEPGLLATAADGVRAMRVIEAAT